MHDDRPGEKGDSIRVTLRARFVFPVSSGPIVDGAVTIAGERIEQVRPWNAQLAGQLHDVVDLGNVALLPGFVNPHTHLEFSDLTAPLGQPGMPFPDWIRAVIAQRRMAVADPASAIAAGLRESLRHGVTALGEIATTDAGATAYAESPLDVTVFREVIGLRQDVVEERYAGLRNWVTQFESSKCSPAIGSPSSHVIAGISPHAPYSVHPDLLIRCATLARLVGAPLAMHLAESREELELLASGGGPFRPLLEKLNAWDDAAIPRGTRPSDYLRALSSPRALIIHGNYLADDEIDFLATHAATMSLIYCPRTHAYFAHDAYPLARLLAEGVSVAVGTDSRASNPDLSVLSELRHIAQRGEIPLADVLRLGTINGARALGLADRIGSLEPGKQADLCCVELPDQNAADPHDLLLRHDGEVRSVWKRGRRCGLATPPQLC